MHGSRYCAGVGIRDCRRFLGLVESQEGAYATSLPQAREACHSPDADRATAADRCVACSDQKNRRAIPTPKNMSSTEVMKLATKAGRPLEAMALKFTLMPSAAMAMPSKM